MRPRISNRPYCHAASPWVIRQLEVYSAYSPGERQSRPAGPVARILDLFAAPFDDQQAAGAARILFLIPLQLLIADKPALVRPLAADRVARPRSNSSDQTSV